MAHGSISASHPAAPGSNPASAKNFSLGNYWSLLLSSRTILRDQAHLMLKQGISQMQLVAKA